MTGIIIPASATTNGTRLDVIRQRLNAEIGYACTGVVTAIGTGLEPERYVISTSYRSDFSPPERFDDLFVYQQPVADGQDGNQREIVRGGFDGPNGAIMVDYPYDSTLPIGTNFEIAALPALDYLGVSGTNTAIQRGAETLPLIDLIDVTASANTIEYSLANYPWPIKSIRKVFCPRTSTTPTNEHRREANGWGFQNDAESPLLVLSYSFNAGDVFTLEVLRNANTRIRQSDVWGDVDSSTGLVLDSDQTLYDASTVVAAAKPHALGFLAERYSRGSKERTDILGAQADAKMSSGIARWYGSFRGDGVQRVGARGSYRRNWWGR